MAQCRALATRAELAERARRATDASAGAADAFRAQVAAFYSAVTAAVQPMVEANPGLRVERGEADGGGALLRIVTAGGGADSTTRDACVEFLLAAEPASLHLKYTSPRSGGMANYEWDPRVGAWVDHHDRHLLVENLARDLIFCCKGYPSF